MTAFSVLVTIVAVILAFILSVFIFQLHSSDAAGNGLAGFYTAVEMGVLWLALAVLLLLSGAQGAFTGWEGAAMCILFLIAAAGAFTSFGLVVENRVGAAMTLVLQLAIIASPVLIITRAVSGIFFRQRSPGSALNLLTALPLLLLALLPWRSFSRMVTERSAGEAAYKARTEQFEEEEKRKVAALNEQYIALLRAMPTSARLPEVMAYTVESSSAVQEEALSRARTLDGRQADAARMMKDDHDGRVLRALLYLDVEATPALCEAARYLLRRVTGEFKPNAPGPNFDESAWQIEMYMPSVEWLATHGCDCSKEIAGLEEALRVYHSSPQRERFLGRLRQLHAAQ